MDTMMDLYVLIGFSPGAGDRHGEEYVSWLVDCGFINIEETALPTQLAIITAEKPQQPTTRLGVNHQCCEPDLQNCWVWASL